MLDYFDVLQEDIFGLGRGVSLYCFDGSQEVLGFVTQEAIEDRFSRRGLTKLA